MELESDQLISNIQDNISIDNYRSYKYYFSIFAFLGSLFITLILIINITSNEFNESHGILLANRIIKIESTNSCIFQYGYYHHRCINSTLLSNIDKTTNKTIYRISIHGDSLVNMSNRLYNFSSNILNRISQRIPNLSFDIIICGESAYNVASVLSTLDEYCLSYQPHSFILYGDSDRRAFEERIIDYKSNLYLSNLDILINRLKKGNVQFIGLAGPGLQGELPNGQNPDDYSAEAYNRANINYAKTHNIAFINIRDKLFKAEKANKGEYGYEHGSHGQYGYLTIDGAHPSFLGNQIIEDMVFKQLEEWYTTIKD